MVRKKRPIRLRNQSVNLVSVMIINSRSLKKTGFNAHLGSLSKIDLRSITTMIVVIVVTVVIVVIVVTVVIEVTVVIAVIVATAVTTEPEVTVSVAAEEIINTMIVITNRLMTLLLLTRNLRICNKLKTPKTSVEVEEVAAVGVIITTGAVKTVVAIMLMTAKTTARSRVTKESQPSRSFTVKSTNPGMITPAKRVNQGCSTSSQTRVLLQESKVAYITHQT